MHKVTFRNLQAEKARHSLTTQDLANVLGLSRQAMTNRIIGHKELDLIEAKKIVDYFNALGSVFCKNFFHKVASCFSLELHLHFP